MFENISKLLNDAMVIGFVLGVTEIFKRAFNLDTKYAPLVSWAVALAFVMPYAVMFMGFGWFEGALAATGIALAASGLWSWGKKAIGQ